MKNHNENDRIHEFESSDSSWQAQDLTAYVLGELGPEAARRMESAANENQQLEAELAEIRATVEALTSAFRSEKELSVAPSDMDAFLTPRNVGQASSDDVVIEKPSVLEKSMQRRRPVGVSLVGLLAMSASLLAALVFGYPVVTAWLSEQDASQLGMHHPPTSQAFEEADKDESQPNLNSAPRATREALPKTVASVTNESIANGSRALASEQEMTNVPSGPIRNDALASGSSADASQGRRPDLPSSGGAGSAVATVVTSPGYGGMPDGYGGMGGMGDLAGMSGGPGGGYGGYGGGGYGGMGGGYGGTSPEPGSGPGGGYGGYGGEGGGYGGYGVGSGYGGERGAYGDAGGNVGGSIGSSGRYRFYRDEQDPFHPEPGSNPVSSSQDRFASPSENPFIAVSDAPLSTFSIDVDTASYAKCRQLLLEQGLLPPPAAVRLEEFVNYFDYQYPGPEGGEPFAAHLAMTTCPWQPQHKLVRIALQAKQQSVAQRDSANIVFLLDVSGSMNAANKLPLVKQAIEMLVEQLDERDRIAMVVYAGAAGCVLESTPGNMRQKILAALDSLAAGGSTNGGQGIQLAYDLAREHFIPNGINRVILCTDGDFNVGVTNTESLVRLVADQAKSKVFLTVLGFGTGNTNDAMMEEISNRGNGVYAFVDTWREAQRQLVQQVAGNLITVAKDVKIQVEFNPRKVRGYRLLGYENRVLADRDFNDDTKDAGEIGAGHRVTAMYEVIPAGVDTNFSQTDDLIFQPAEKSVDERTEKPIEQSPDDTLSAALLAVKLRYKQPEGDVSQKLVFPLQDSQHEYASADADFRWAATAVGFGMLLRHSQYSGNLTWDRLVLEARSIAESGGDQQRDECLQMMQRARQLMRSSNGGYPSVQGGY
ncbi:MAG: von Willebrand factor type A domain-containing protein [Planctomycetales bacterium]|nr:von Willebrand factor type A domain-containing protein [Planctomycetales bacterium]